MKIGEIANIYVCYHLLFVGCQDKAMVNIYNKNITKIPIECLRLNVTPHDKEISNALQELYDFSSDCDLMLDVSYKSGIKCNSNYNVAQKTLNSFPTSYLKMELRKGMTLQYSYYIDLAQKPTKDDIVKGFGRLREDLQFR